MMRVAILAIALIFGIIVSNACAEEERWAWSNRNRRQQDFQDKHNEKFHDTRLAREREPTTRRPAPGVSQNEEIDDYTDEDDKKIGARNYPFVSNGLNSGQYGGGGFGGFPASNGILVGPGGPTGIIGRPQYSYPGAGNAGGFLGTFGQPDFGSNSGGNFGFPQQQPAGFGGGINNFPNSFGQPQGFAGAQGAQFPGVYQNHGQIPNQFGGAQFPGVSNQYPGVASQYPGGNQYPGIGPIYTEGYGLLTNGYPPIGSNYPQAPFNNLNGIGFDEHNQSNRRLQIVSKSSSVEGRNIVDAKINDKLSKHLKKSA